MIYINFDMDGVVADFDTFASDLLEREVNWNHDITKDEWTKLAAVPNFYQKLPVMENSVQFVKNVQRLVEDLRQFTRGQFQVGIRFLTAIPKRSSMPTSEQDKKIWASVHFPGIPVEIGPYSEDKQNWCNPGDVLIDDKKSNIDEWNAKGGIGIYHTGNDFTTTNRTLVTHIMKHLSSHMLETL